MVKINPTGTHTSILGVSSVWNSSHQPDFFVIFHGSRMQLFEIFQVVKDLFCYGIYDVIRYFCAGAEGSFHSKGIDVIFVAGRGIEFNGNICLSIKRPPNLATL